MRESTAIATVMIAILICLSVIAIHNNHVDGKTTILMLEKGYVQEPRHVVPATWVLRGNTH